MGKRGRDETDFFAIRVVIISVGIASAQDDERADTTFRLGLEGYIGRAVLVQFALDHDEA